MRMIGICLAAMALPDVGWAKPMTYDQAIASASGSAPLNEAARQRIASAQSAARAAGALPDPRLSLSLENFPISGPPAFEWSADEMTMTRIGVAQELPNPAKRQAARIAAQSEIRVAEAEAAVQARQVRLDTALAWIDLAYAERRLAAVDRLLDQLRPLTGSLHASVASGSARPAQTLDAVQALAVLEDRRSELMANAGRARATLARWTGDPAPSIAGQAPALSVDATLLRAALEGHPEIGSADASLRRAEAEVQVAVAEKRPDFGVELAYGHRSPRFGDMMSAGVSISLPLFAARRQDPRIAARQAEAARVLAQREDARRALAAELEAGLADHVMHHEQWMRATETLLPLARQRVQLETASYGAGRASLVEVVQSYSMLAEAELTALDREAEVVRDAARLTTTFGQGSQ